MYIHVCHTNLRIIQYFYCSCLWLDDDTEKLTCSTLLNVSFSLWLRSRASNQSRLCLCLQYLELFLWLTVTCREFCVRVCVFQKYTFLLVQHWHKLVFLSFFCSLCPFWEKKLDCRIFFNYTATCELTFWQLCRTFLVYGDNSLLAPDVFSMQLSNSLLIYCEIFGSGFRCKFALINSFLPLPERTKITWAIHKVNDSQMCKFQKQQKHFNSKNL